MNITIHSTAGIVLITAVALSFSTPQKAEAKQWNMCAWEEIPRSVLKRIVQRSDYSDILERMSDSCPEAAFALLNPSTVSTSDFVPKRSNVRNDGDNGDVNGFSKGGDTGGVAPDSSGNSANRSGSEGSSGTSDNGNSSGSSRSAGSSGSSGGSGSSDSSGSSDGESSSAGDGSGNSGGSDDGNGGRGHGSSANNGGGNGSEGGSPGKGHGANNDE